MFFLGSLGFGLWFVVEANRKETRRDRHTHTTRQRPVQLLHSLSCPQTAQWFDPSQLCYICLEWRTRYFGDEQHTYKRNIKADFGRTMPAPMTYREVVQGEPLEGERFNGEGGVRKEWWWQAGPVDS